MSDHSLHTQPSHTRKPTRSKELVVDKPVNFREIGKIVPPPVVEHRTFTTEKDGIILRAHTEHENRWEKITGLLIGHMEGIGWWI
ncbi:myb domain protein 73 [Striga hermonthica]|uniref:Myb domain protein 73 n=1 Tax=Striga hermonthica TaxID=68872 RepID=A0A9N7ND07_STRHE|nr:myb domain protein 73 [Striga hermonthica]